MDNPPQMPPLPPPPDGPSQPPGSGPFAFPPPPEESPGWGAPRGFYPLDFDRITRNAWSVFRFAWPTFLGAALIPSLVVMAITIPVLVATAPAFNEWLAAYRDALATGRVPTFSPDVLWSLALIVLVNFVGAIIGGLVIGAATMHIGDSIFRGRPVTIRSALGTGLRRLPVLIGAMLLYLLAAFGIALLGFTFGVILSGGGGATIFLGLVAMVAAVAAVLFIAIRFSLLIQAVVLEKQGAVEGLSRSWRLVSGSGWRVLGYAMFVAVISGLIGGVIGAIPDAILRLSPTSTASVVLGGVVQGLLTVVVAPTALITLFLYYDLRFKHGEPAPQPGEDRESADGRPEA